MTDLRFLAERLERDAAVARDRAREGVLRRKYFKDGAFIDDAVFALLRPR
jgi:hypothetical protein